MIPTIIEKCGNKEHIYDIHSRLLKDRIIVLSDEINSYTANNIIAMLLYLDSVNFLGLFVFITT